MRYIAWILVVANLAFFTWNVLLSPAPAPVAARVVPVPPGIDPLLLLSERGGNAAADVAAVSIPQSVESEPVDDSSETPQSDVDTAPDSEPGIAGRPVQRVCRTVGPFLDKQDATLVFATLAKQGYVVDVRDGDVREPAGYWVYLPAMPAQDARRIVADLDKQGMKDYFIGKQNHISLGIFSGKGKAQLRQQTVKRLGYDAVLDQRFRMRDVYWLDVEEQDQPLLESETWSKLQAQHTDIRAQRVSCE